MQFSRAGWTALSARRWTNATGCAPTSVLVAPSGTIYVTELHYDLLREVEGVAFATPGVVSTNGGTNGVVTTNTVIPPPAFSPNSGYFPECQTIYVTSSVPSVYYTTDGTAPTTNSLMVPNMVTVLPTTPALFRRLIPVVQFPAGFEFLAPPRRQRHQRQRRDQRSQQPRQPNRLPVCPVRRQRFDGGPSFGGQFAKQHHAGLAAIRRGNHSDHRRHAAHFGRSASCRSPPTISSSSPGRRRGICRSVSRPSLTRRGATGWVWPFSRSALASGLNVQNFAVVTLLEVPIPPTAAKRQSYTLNVRFPSGTSDGVPSQRASGPHAHRRR